MDFSVLVADLRDVAEKYKGKTTEPQVSTVVYVDMFTKILQRAERLINKYEDQIMMLWVALNQLATLYKDLAAGSARDQLSRFIFGMCARTVLNIQWPQLEEDNTVKQNFCKTVENVHEILTGLGFNRFQLILDLMENHWTHPTLTQIMSGDEEDEIEDGLEYIQKQDPEILKLRIEIMMKENCEEFALNLCTWSLKHQALKNDLKIKEHQIVIMYKQQMYNKMQEVCESIICHDGIKVMAHLAKNQANQSLCIRLAQIFLIQDWLKPDRNCCTQELLKLWIHHQYLDDKDEERFLDSIWAVAKVSRTTEQIGVLIDGVRKECGDTFIQLYTELCKYAINIDKGNMEKELEKENLEAVKERQFSIAKTCVRMAYMLKEYDFRIAKICGLTAFALDTTFDSLNLVNRLYWTVKFTSATSEESRINPATLYEIERLLQPLRPDVLDPEFTWKKIIPLCKKYKTERDVLLKESCQYVPVLSDPKQSLKYFKKVNNTSANQIPSCSREGSRTETNVLLNANADNTKEQELKRPTAVDIDRLLGHQFPRGVGKNMNDFSMKDLDKTINDLKKSINEETEYRKMLTAAGFTSNTKGEKKTKGQADTSVKKERAKKVTKTVQQSVPTSVAAKIVSPSNRQVVNQNQNSQLYIGQTNFQPYQASDIKMTPPAAHRNTPGPLSPPVSYQSSPGFRSPPIAHANHPSASTKDVSSPQPSSSNQFHPQVYRPNSSSAQFSSSYIPVVVNQTAPMSSSSSAIARPPSASPSSSDVLKQTLNTKIHSDMLRKDPNISGSVSSLNIPQSSLSGLQRQNSAPNLMTSVSAERKPYTIEYSTASSSPAECARIAQQIAQMHLKQRAEREKLEGKMQRKPRQKKDKDVPKTSLTSRSIPSSSQISELLSQTMKGTAESSAERVQNIIHIRNQILQAESGNRLGSYVNQSNESACKTNVNSQTVANEPILNRTICESDQTGEGKSQKFYLTSASVMDKLKKDKTESKGFSVKPVFSMVVPRALTSPDNQNELVRRVTDMVKKATSSKGSTLSAFSSPVESFAHLQSEVKSSTPCTKQTQVKTVEELKSTPVPDHVLEFLKNRSKSEPHKMVVRSVSMTTYDQNANSTTLQNSPQLPVQTYVTTRTLVPGMSSGVLSQATSVNTGVTDSSVSQLAALTGIVLPQNQSSLNILASVASNSIALPGQPHQSKIPVTFGNQNQVTVTGIPDETLVTSYSQPTDNLFPNITQQTVVNQPAQRISVLQPNVPQTQQVMLQNIDMNVQVQPSVENRIRLPVTSSQSDARFMHVFDQFGNKQIVNMTPQTHLIQAGGDNAGLTRGSETQFQSIGGVQNNFSQQLLPDSGLLQQASPYTVNVNNNFNTLQSVVTALGTESAANVASQIHAELTTVSDIVSSVTPQAAASVTRQQFNVVPELSPALVQQILTDLMKTGSRQDLSSSTQCSSSFMRNAAENSALPLQSQHKREIYIIPKSLAERAVDGTVQIVKNSNSSIRARNVSDHTKKIVSGKNSVSEVQMTDRPIVSSQPMNQDFQTFSPQNYSVNIASPTSFQSPTLSSSSGSQSVTCNQSVTGTLTASGSLSQFYSPNYVTSSVLSTTQAASISSSITQLDTTLTPSQTPITSQLLQVPDLPDLGSKEFGIDEILSTDNNTDQNNQRPNDAELNPRKEVFKNKSNEIRIDQSTSSHRTERNQEEIQKTSERSRIPNTDQNCIQINSDQDMLEHVESVLSGKTSVSLAAKTLCNAVKHERKFEQGSTADHSRSNYQTKGQPSLPVCTQNKQNSVGEKPSRESQIGPASENIQQGQMQSSLTPGQSTFFNAARLAKEREEREMKLKQEKPVPKHTADKIALHVCSICSEKFDSVEKLREHVKLNLCPSRICKLCERVFASLEQLRNHLKVPCKGSKEKLKDFEYTKIFVCSKCNFTSQNEKIGTKHVENCNVSNSPIKAKVTIWYKCHMCREVLHDKDLAYKHISRFCPQLKAVKAMQDVQKCMDRLRNKPDITARELKKSDNTHKDLKDFIPENRTQDNRDEMHTVQKSSVKFTSHEDINIKDPNMSDSGSQSKESVLPSACEKQNKVNESFNQTNHKHLPVSGTSENSDRIDSSAAQETKVSKQVDESIKSIRNEKCADDESETMFGRINGEEIRKPADVVNRVSEILNERNEEESGVLKENKDRCLEIKTKSSIQGTQTKSHKQKAKSVRNQSKKRSILNERYGTQQVVSSKVEKHKEPDVIGKSSTCKLCLYSTTIERSLARHYTQAHDFGFKLQNKRYRCKYCDVSFQSASKLMIKGHMMKHSDILLKQIAKSKHLNRNHPHLTPEKCITSQAGNLKDYSPRKMERVKKHIKAKAARSKCAENLRKIAYSCKPSEDDQHIDDGDGSGDDRENNDTLEDKGPKSEPRGRPRKYPVGQEPYRLHKSFYNKQQKQTKESKKSISHSGLNKTQAQRKSVQTRNLRSRSNSMGPHADKLQDELKAFPQKDTTMKKEENIKSKSGLDKPVDTKSKNESSLYQIRRHDAAKKGKHMKQDNDSGQEFKQADKKEDDSKRISLRSKLRNRERISSEVDTSDSDSDDTPSIPMRERLRKRKIDEVSVNETTKLMPETKAGKESKGENEVDSSASFKENAKEKSLLPGSKKKKMTSRQDLLQNTEVDFEDKVDVKKSLRQRKSKSMEHYSDREDHGTRNDLADLKRSSQKSKASTTSDEDEDINGTEDEESLSIIRCLRPRKRQTMELNSDVELEESIESFRTLRSGKRQQLHLVSGTDDELSDHDSGHEVHMRKRQRRRSSTKDAEHSSKAKSKNLHSDLKSKMKNSKMNGSETDASEDDLKYEKAHIATRSGRKTRVPSQRDSLKLQMKGSGKSIASASSESSSSENEGRATPVKKRLRERKSSGGVATRITNSIDLKGMSQSMTVNKEDKKSLKNVEQMKSGTELVENSKKYVLRDRSKSNLKGNDDSFQGDFQASIDVIFDAVEKEFESLNTSAFKEEDSKADEEIKIRSSTEKNVDSEVDVSRDFNIKKQREPIDNQPLKKKSKNISDDSIEIPSGQKSFSVLLDPDDDLVGTEVRPEDDRVPNSNQTDVGNTATEVIQENNSQGSVLLNSDKLEDNRVLTDKVSKISNETQTDFKATVVSEDEDEFSFVRSLDGVSSEKTDISSTGLPSAHKTKENFGSEFLKFTQKRFANRVSSSDSDSDSESVRKLYISNGKENDSALQVGENLVSDQEGDLRGASAANFDAAFKAFAGVSSVHSESKRHCIKQKGTKGEEEIQSKQFSMMARNRVLPFDEKDAQRSDHSISESSQSNMRQKDMPDITSTNKLENKICNEDGPSSGSMNQEEQHEATNYVCVKKKTGFVDAFEEFFRRSRDQPLKQDAVEQFRPLAARGSQQTGNETEHMNKALNGGTKLKNLRESLPECCVHLKRLTDEEINRYKKTSSSVRHAKERPKKPVEVIILDSGEESDGEDVVILVYDESELDGLSSEKSDKSNFENNTVSSEKRPSSSFIGQETSGFQEVQDIVETKIIADNQREKEGITAVSLVDVQETTAVNELQEELKCCKTRMEGIEEPQKAEEVELENGVAGGGSGTSGGHIDATSLEMVTGINTDTDVTSTESLTITSAQKLASDVKNQIYTGTGIIPVEDSACTDRIDGISTKISATTDEDLGKKSISELPQMLAAADAHNKEKKVVSELTDLTGGSVSMGESNDHKIGETSVKIGSSVTTAPVIDLDEKEVSEDQEVFQEIHHGKDSLTAEEFGKDNAKHSENNLEVHLSEGNDVCESRCLEKAGKGNTVTQNMEESCQDKISVSPEREKLSENIEVQFTSIETVSIETLEKVKDEAVGTMSDSQRSDENDGNEPASTCMTNLSQNKLFQKDCNIINPIDISHAEVEPKMKTIAVELLVDGATNYLDNKDDLSCATNDIFVNEMADNIQTTASIEFDCSVSFTAKELEPPFTADGQRSDDINKNELESMTIISQNKVEKELNTTESLNVYHGEPQQKNKIILAERLNHDTKNDVVKKDNITNADKSINIEEAAYIRSSEIDNSRNSFPVKIPEQLPTDDSQKCDEEYENEFEVACKTKAFQKKHLQKDINITDLNDIPHGDKSDFVPVTETIKESKIDRAKIMGKNHCQEIPSQTYFNDEISLSENVNDSGLMIVPINAAIAKTSTETVDPVMSSEDGLGRKGQVSETDFLGFKQDDSAEIDDNVTTCFYSDTIEGQSAKTESNISSVTETLKVTNGMHTTGKSKLHLNSVCGKSDLPVSKESNFLQTPDEKLGIGTLSHVDRSECDEYLDGLNPTSVTQRDAVSVRETHYFEEQISLGLSEMNKTPFAQDSMTENFRGIIMKPHTDIPACSEYENIMKPEPLESKPEFTPSESVHSLKGNRMECLPHDNVSSLKTKDGAEGNSDTKRFKNICEQSKVHSLEEEVEIVDQTLSDKCMCDVKLVTYSDDESEVETVNNEDDEANMVLCSHLSAKDAEGKVIEEQKETSESISISNCHERDEIELQEGNQQIEVPESKCIQDSVDREELVTVERDWKTDNQIGVSISDVQKCRQAETSTIEPQTGQQAKGFESDSMLNCNERDETITFETDVKNCQQICVEKEVLQISKENEKFENFCSQISVEKDTVICDADIITSQCCVSETEQLCKPVEKGEVELEACHQQIEVSESSSSIERIGTMTTNRDLKIHSQINDSDLEEGSCLLSEADLVELQASKQDDPSDSQSMECSDDRSSTFIFEIDSNTPSQICVSNMEEQRKQAESFKPAHSRSIDEQNETLFHETEIKINDHSADTFVPFNNAVKSGESICIPSSNESDEKLTSEKDRKLSKVINDAELDSKSNSEFKEKQIEAFKEDQEVPAKQEKEVDFHVCMAESSKTCDQKRDEEDLVNNAEAKRSSELQKEEQIDEFGIRQEIPSKKGKELHFCVSSTQNSKPSDQELEAAKQGVEALERISTQDVCVRQERGTCEWDRNMYSQISMGGTNVQTFKPQSRVFENTCIPTNDRVVSMASPAEVNSTQPLDETVRTEEECNSSFTRDINLDIHVSESERSSEQKQGVDTSCLNSATQISDLESVVATNIVIFGNSLKKDVPAESKSETSTSVSSLRNAIDAPNKLDSQDKLQAFEQPYVDKQVSGSDMELIEHSKRFESIPAAENESGDNASCKFVSLHKTAELPYVDKQVTESDIKLIEHIDATKNYRDGELEKEDVAQEVSHEAVSLTKPVSDLGRFVEKSFQEDCLDCQKPPHETCVIIDNRFNGSEEKHSSKENVDEQMQETTDLTGVLNKGDIERDVQENQEMEGGSMDSLNEISNSDSENDPPNDLVLETKKRRVDDNKLANEPVSFGSECKFEARLEQPLEDYLCSNTEEASEQVSELHDSLLDSTLGHKTANISELDTVAVNTERIQIEQETNLTSIEESRTTDSSDDDLSNGNNNTRTIQMDEEYGEKMAQEHVENENATFEGCDSVDMKTDDSEAEKSFVQIPAETEFLQSADFIAKKLSVQDDRLTLAAVATLADSHKLMMGCEMSQLEVQELDQDIVQPLVLSKGNLHPDTHDLELNTVDTDRIKPTDKCRKCSLQNESTMQISSALLTDEFKEQELSVEEVKCESFAAKIEFKEESDATSKTLQMVKDVNNTIGEDNLMVSELPTKYEVADTAETKLYLPPKKERTKDLLAAVAMVPSEEVEKTTEAGTSYLCSLIEGQQVNTTAEGEDKFNYETSEMQMRKKADDSLEKEEVSAMLQSELSNKVSDKSSISEAKSITSILTESEDPELSSGEGKLDKVLLSRNLEIKNDTSETRTVQPKRLKETQHSTQMVYKVKSKVVKAPTMEIPPSVEEVDEQELEEFNKRTESVKKSLKKSRGKGYQCDFNFEEDDDMLSTCSNSSSGTSFSSHGQEFESIKSIPGTSLENECMQIATETSRTKSPFQAAECTLPPKNSVSTMTAKMASRRTYYNRGKLVSKVLTDKKYSKKIAVIRSDLINCHSSEVPDRNLLPLDVSNAGRKVSLPKISTVTSQYSKLSLPLRDEPDSPRSVSSGESNSGTESVDSGTQDTPEQTLHSLKSFRRLHSEEAPFTWDMDYDEDEKGLNSKSKKAKERSSNSSENSLNSKQNLSVTSLRKRSSCTETPQSNTTEKQDSNFHEDNHGGRRLRSPSITKELPVVVKKSPSVTKQSANKKRASVKASQDISNKGILSRKKNLAHGTSKDIPDSVHMTTMVKDVQGPASVKHIQTNYKPTRKSTDCANLTSSVSKKEQDRNLNIAKTRSLSCRHLLTQTGAVSYVHEKFPTDVDGSIISDSATLFAKTTSKLPDLVKRESQKEKAPIQRSVKRKSVQSEIENVNSHEEKEQSVSKESNGGEIVTISQDPNEQNKEFEMQQHLKDSLSEPLTKQAKLCEHVKLGDEVKLFEKQDKFNTNETEQESEETCSAACHNDSSAASCNECKKQQKDQKSPNSKSYNVLYKPTVRRIVHGGRVIEIKKGSITETEISSASPTPRSRDLSPQSLDKIKKRLESGSTESPKKKKARNLKSDGNVDTVETSLLVKTNEDLNKYIHATLKEIRKERQQRQPEHYLRQPKQESEDSKWKLTKSKDKYPYSFKRSRPVNR